MSAKKPFGAQDVLAAFQKSSALQNNAPHGLQYSEVQYIHPNELSANVLNEKLFPEEDGDRFDKLAEDIRERGITTPLIAKKDKTLLAGHNRLRIALQLHLSSVPVRFLESTISQHDELVYVIKDNILRRQFRHEDYVRLYKMMYENFEERLAKRHEVTPATRVLHSDPSEAPITATIVARDTGQNVKTVQSQLSKFEKQSRRESAKNRKTQEEVALTSKEKSNEMMIARQREANLILKNAVGEILMQIQRPDVGDEWRRKSMQKVMAAMEKAQKLLPI